MAKVIKRDCFGYEKQKGCCAVLRKTECENCAFYKDKKQAKADREKARNRILFLPEDERLHIEENYGKR